MLIQCTKKLLEAVEIRPSIPHDEGTLFSWHANFITLDRAKTVVLMNDKNHFVILLSGLQPEDNENMGDIIHSAIREALLNEGIKSEIIEDYLEAAREIVFTKTNDRSKVAMLNNVCGSKEFTCPCEAMYHDLEIFAGQPIFQKKAVKIKVMLKLKNHCDVWRRLIIPYDISFENFHTILQIAFSWQNLYLHDFIIFDKVKPIIKLVQRQEDIVYPAKLPMLAETGVKIAECIPKYKRLLYHYNLSEEWEHTIFVEDFVFNYDKNYPVCLDGEGDAPPEDAGSGGRRKGLLKKWNNTTFDSHKRIKESANRQLHREYNIDFINRALKNSLYKRTI